MKLSLHIEAFRRDMILKQSPIILVISNLENNLNTIINNLSL